MNTEVETWDCETSWRMVVVGKPNAGMTDISKYFVQQRKTFQEIIVERPCPICDIPGLTGKECKMCGVMYWMSRYKDGVLECCPACLPVEITVTGWYRECVQIECVDASFQVYQSTDLVVAIYYLGP